MDFVGWGELLTAEWVQAWGSIASAALGAGLAVYGAVWFQRREDRQRAHAYKKMLLYLLTGIRSSVAVTHKQVQESWPLTAYRHLESQLGRDLEQLNRFSPYFELQDLDAASKLLDLQAGVSDLRSSIEFLLHGIPAHQSSDYTLGEIRKRCEQIDHQWPALEKAGLVRAAIGHL